jgi:ParB family chromosome partitioning protein
MKASADRSAAKKLRAKPSAAAAEPRAGTEEFYGRKTASAPEPSAAPPAPREPTATASQHPAQAAAEVPVPVQNVPTGTASGGNGQESEGFPYRDGTSAAHHLISGMPPGEFDKMLDLLIQHRDRLGTAAR